jgi:hypothetical protein
VEIDFLISGIPFIDVEDLIQSFEFELPFSENHPTIQFLFEFLREADSKNLSLLLNL